MWFIIFVSGDAEMNKHSTSSVLCAVASSTGASKVKAKGSTFFCETGYPMPLKHGT